MVEVAEAAPSTSEDEAVENAKRGDPCARCRPIGAKEIAEVLKVKPNTVHIWKYRELLPEPRWHLSGQPVWALSDIEGWARATGRWPDRPGRITGAA